MTGLPTSYDTWKAAPPAEFRGRESNPDADGFEVRDALNRKARERAEFRAWLAQQR